MFYLNYFFIRILQNIAMAIIGVCIATPRDLEISVDHWTQKIKTKTQVQKQNFFDFLAIKIKHFLSVYDADKCKFLQETFFINVPKMYS